MVADDPRFPPPRPPRGGSAVKPPPPSDFTLGGWYIADLRIRASWFGLSVVEELYVYRDGTKKWKRAWGGTEAWRRGRDSNP